MATQIVQRYIDSLPTFDQLDLDKLSFTSLTGLSDIELAKHERSDKNHHTLDWDVLMYGNDRFVIQHTLIFNKRHGIALTPSQALSNIEAQIADVTGHCFRHFEDENIDILDFKDVSNVFHISKDQIVTHFSMDALSWFSKQPDVTVRVVLSPNLSKFWDGDETDAMSNVTKWQWEVLHVLIYECEEPDRLDATKSK